MQRKGRQSNKSKWYWADGLSIDETRVSTLMVMSSVGFFYSLYAHSKTGGISVELLDLIKFLILSTVGINGVHVISDTLQRRREDSKEPPYNDGDKE